MTRRTGVQRSLLAALAAAMAWRVAVLPVDHDIAWLLHVAGRVLDGERLYVDLIEINPPLVVWLNLPVVALARLTGADAALLYRVLVLAGAVASTIAVARLSRHAIERPYRPHLVVAVAVGLFGFALPQWGQREHLMLILGAPYLVAAAGRARGFRPGRPVVLGMLAGLGFALKPYFLPVPLVVESWLFVKRRTADRTAVAVVGTVALYGAAVLVLTPEYLPLALELRGLYERYGVPDRAQLAAVLLVGGLGVVLMLVDGAGKEARTAFGLALWGWLLAVTLQWKGFSYHYVPVFAGLAVLGTLAFAGPGSRRGARSTATFAAGVFVVLGAVTAFRPRPRPVFADGGAEIEAVARDVPLVVLTTRMEEAWPYARAGDWVAPLQSMWPLRLGGDGPRRTAAWLAPALDSGAVVLVPNNARRNALPDLIKEPVFRESWRGYVASDTLRHFTIYRRP